LVSFFGDSCSNNWVVNKPNPLQHFIYEGFDTWIEVDLPSHHQNVSQDIGTMIRELDEKWDRFDQSE
jgi:hypothetical protein